MIRIQGGFFWVRGEEAAITIIGNQVKGGSGGIFIEDVDSPCVIENCVFMVRPRWWQLGRWFFALRCWLPFPPTIESSLQASANWRYELYLKRRERRAMRMAARMSKRGRDAY
jgi:hypothetical protein